MKIGFVFDDSLDTTDGIQQYVFSLANWLTDHGHEVHYLVGETKRSDLPNVHSLSKNIHVTFNGNRLSIPLFGSRRRIRQVLKCEGIDVLHVQLPYHPFMAGWVMRMAPSSTGIIGTFHILPYGRLAVIGGWLQWLLSRPSQRRLHAVVSVSPGAQRFAERIYKLQSSVVPNVFDHPRFAIAQPLPQYQDDKLTILFLGRLVQRKGCQILLQALHILANDGQAYPDYRVVVCGGGQMEAELSRYAETHGLQSIVEFVGRVSEAEKPRYYASADISVFPSISGESFGIVLLEAMASGRSAVIGGNNPGYRSVLEVEPATLFTVNDAEALADKLRQLLIDPAERQRLADWAGSAAPQYDVDVVGKQILALYQSVAKNSRNQA